MDLIPVLGAIAGGVVGGLFLLPLWDHFLARLDPHDFAHDHDLGKLGILLALFILSAVLLGVSTWIGAIVSWFLFRKRIGLSDSAYDGPPYPKSDAYGSLATGILLTVITLGFYLFFWQYRQFKVLNSWLGRKEYSFWPWYFLGVVTFGIYIVYHEYKMANGICEIQRKRGWPENPQLGIICLCLSVCGIGVASMAIQQEEINKFYQQS